VRAFSCFSGSACTTPTGSAGTCGRDINSGDCTCFGEDGSEGPDPDNACTRL
jgi:hypothetical protein